jgi:hypothetical protein
LFVFNIKTNAEEGRKEGKNEDEKKKKNNGLSEETHGWSKK